MRCGADCGVHEDRCRRQLFFRQYRSPDGWAVRWNQRRIPLIEAAQAICTEFNARKAESFGNVGVFTFHGSKTLTTGEGGMLVTGGEGIRDRVLFLRDDGRLPGRKM